MRVKPSRRFTTLVKKKAVEKCLNVRTLALAVNIDIERLEYLLEEDMQSLKMGELVRLTKVLEINTNKFGTLLPYTLKSGW